MGNSSLRILSPLIRRLPHPHIEQILAHGAELLLEAPINEARLVFGAGFDAVEGGQVVQVLVVQLVGDPTQVGLRVREVVGNATIPYILERKRCLHLIPVAVQSLTLSVVVPDEVSSVVMRAYA